MLPLIFLPFKEHFDFFYSLDLFGGDNFHCLFSRLRAINFSPVLMPWNCKEIWCNP